MPRGKPKRAESPLLLWLRLTVCLCFLCARGETSSQGRSVWSSSRFVHSVFLYGLSPLLSWGSVSPKQTRWHGLTPEFGPAVPAVALMVDMEWCMQLGQVFSR